jgi:hypothetical protein
MEILQSSGQSLPTLFSKSGSAHRANPRGTAGHDAVEGDPEALGVTVKGHLQGAVFVGHRKATG